MLLVASVRGGKVPNWTHHGSRSGYRREIRETPSGVYWYGGIPEDDEPERPAFACGIANTVDEACANADDACKNAYDYAFFRLHVIDGQSITVWLDDQDNWRWSAGGNFRGRMAGMEVGYADSAQDAYERAKAYVHQRASTN